MDFSNSVISFIVILCALPLNAGDSHQILNQSPAHMPWYFSDSSLSKAKLPLMADEVLLSSPNFSNVGRRYKRTIQRQPHLNCEEELRKLCPKQAKSDDLSLLECVVKTDTYQKNPSNKIQGCQHEVYQQVIGLISNSNPNYHASESQCGQDLHQLNCTNVNAPNGVLLCALSHIDDIKSMDCQNYIRRIEQVAFNDFSFLSQFLVECTSDIKSLKCAPLESDRKAQSQLRVLLCLQNSIDSLSSKCRRQILDLSALQAENINLDHELYAACADDHSRFCPKVQPGSGKVYKCLLQFRMDTTMTSSCRNQLGRYEKLIAQDFRVSRGLVRACKNFIHLHHCRRDVSDDKNIRLAQILLCLEGSTRNGTKVSRDCEIEMMEHRKILMENYQLSPEIVSRCSGDIETFCKTLELGGETIHCLMEHSRPKRRKEGRKNRVSMQCQRAIEVLVKEVDAGEDWRVDIILREACKPVVDMVCQDVRGGDARVMHCLMDKLGTDHMTEACESALLQIQYFVARDFKLDPQLYRQCKEDAVRLCHAKKAWHDESGQMDPERGPLVLPCLYRYAYHQQSDVKLEPQCLEEVSRVMRQRALSVDLHPDVEQACFDDLSVYCTDKTGRGQEMLCLQDRLEKLRPQCREMIGNLTEDQARQVELNPVIASLCKSVMRRHCEAEQESGRDDGDMMECLIKHKNEADVREDYKCRAAIEHFQLISLKDYRFTYKFREACQRHVVRYCPKPRTKYDVISCLSEVVRNDTIADVRPRISKECRQQLRAQLFQQRENVDFDPKLKAACKVDITNLCSAVGQGSAKTLECLRMYRKVLTRECHKAIFKVEYQELTDNSIDYSLMTVCRDMINNFCHDEPPTEVLRCLKNSRNDYRFKPDCRKIVIHRMIEENSDYRLNPDLVKSCHPDINKFCSKFVSEQQPDKELEGKVVSCLKVKFRASKLRKECEDQMELILRESALNYQLNPLLSRMCEEDIKALCRPMSEQEAEGQFQGAVEECLKTALQKGSIKDKACRLEVLALVEESQADIHVDPILNKACALDLQKYCSEMEQGNGRLIHCLMFHLANTSAPLDQKCRKMLGQRVELYKFVNMNSEQAVIAPPKTVQELYHQVKSSPSGNFFFLSALLFVCGIFLLGAFCGRSRRKANKIK